MTYPLLPCGCNNLQFIQQFIESVCKTYWNNKKVLVADVHSTLLIHSTLLHFTLCSHLTTPHPFADILYGLPLCCFSTSDDKKFVYINLCSIHDNIDELVLKVIGEPVHLIIEGLMVQVYHLTS